MLAHFCSDSVQILPLLIPTPDGASISARLYQPAATTRPPLPQLLPLYVHLHSGGLHAAGHLHAGPDAQLDAEAPLCAHLCAAARKSPVLRPAGVAVLHVCCRHTPEYTYPTQVGDAHAALAFLFAVANAYGIDTTRVVVGATGSRAHGQRPRSAARPDGTAATAPPRPKGLLLSSALNTPGVRFGLAHLAHAAQPPHPAYPTFQPYTLAQCADAVQLGFDLLRQFHRMHQERHTDADARSGIDSAASQNRAVNALLDLPGTPRGAFDEPRLWPLAVLHAAAQHPDDDALRLEQRLRQAGMSVRLHVHRGCAQSCTAPGTLLPQQWGESLLDELAWLLDEEPTHAQPHMLTQKAVVKPPDPGLPTPDVPDWLDGPD